MNGSDNEIPQCPNVLLSIKPDHADAILSGEKRYEYRRVAPARGSVFRLVLYASSPEQAAVGTAWVHTVKEAEPKQLVDETVGSTPHTEDEVLEYFDGADTGYALRIGAYYRFNDPVPLEKLEAADLEPSQNFRYIGNVPKEPEAVDAEAVVPGMETSHSEPKPATDGGTGEHEDAITRPKRDVSARTSVGQCDHCGGNANSTLCGEHIWKCSEIIPKAALEKFVDDLRHNSERRSFAEFDAETADQIADELEELIR